MRRWFVAVSSSLYALCASGQAWANEPATANSLQLGVGARFGVAFADSGYDPLGLGFGVEAGYTLPDALYLGANFDYFLGGRQDEPDEYFQGNLSQAMAQLGYDVGFGEVFVIRPRLGVGAASL